MHHGRFLGLRHGQRRVLNSDRSPYAGLLIEDLGYVPRQAHAAVGNGVTAHFADVQTQPCVGETLPVRHGRAVKTAAFRNGIGGFRIVVDAFAFRIIHFAVQIGNMVLLFGDDGVVARFGRVGLDTGREREVHGDESVHQVLPPLVIQADKDLARFLRRTLQQGVILVNIVGFLVVLAGYEVRVRGRMEGVFVFRNGFVQGAGVRQGGVFLAGVGTGHPPHAEHGEDGQREEALHKWRIRNEGSGLFGTWDRQFLVDVNQVGLEPVGFFECGYGSAVSAGNGAQGIALLHGIGPGLGSGLPRSFFGNGVAGGAGGFGRRLPRGRFLVDGGFGGRVVGVVRIARHRAVMAGFIRGIGTFRNPRRNFPVGYGFRSIVASRGRFLAGAGGKRKDQRGSAGAG